MCLVTFQYQMNSDYPLIVVQNRDEVYERKSQAIHFWKDSPRVLGGRDQVHGGTWAGLTQDGRLATLTNRPFDDFPAIEDSLSRGKLVKDYLTGKSKPLETLAYLKENRFNYDSYQLVFGSVDDLHVYSNATDKHRTFEPGLHAVSNTADDLSKHKEDRSIELVGEYVKNHPEPKLDDLIELFKDKKKAEKLDTFPSEISHELAKANSSIFINGDRFGTVNTTAFLVHKSGRVTMKEVRYNQDGPIETTEKQMQLD